MAMTEDDLYARLDALGIAWRTITHAPVYTVEQSRELRGVLPGAHVKNLFLRDKKRTLWLVTTLEDRAIDLKALRSVLDSRGTLSFGSAALLMDTLGVAPGSVTPFAVVNDRERVVNVVLDAGILDHEAVNAHPLRNDRTTAVATQDLLRLLEAEGYEVRVVDFG